MSPQLCVLEPHAPRNAISRRGAITAASDCAAHAPVFPHRTVEGGHDVVDILFANTELAVMAVPSDSVVCTGLGVRLGAVRRGS